ncbi:hypothetical protein BD770DRAFT_413155 [Pilaira anomala]|nr:hypothetical protein BD770DRAFT_413155 [Pilaira anomala]
MNIYVPADSNVNRRSFFEALSDLLYNLRDTITWDNLIISGDFNYDMTRDIDSNKGLYKTSTQWLSILEIKFYNAMIHNEMQHIPTFQRTAGIVSTIDYIYLGHVITTRLVDNSLQYIHSNWSGHALLQITLKIGPAKIGPGLWRENDNLELRITPQTLWDGIKRRLLNNVLNRLKRNNFLRSKPPIATRIMILPRIDNMIEALQQELVEIAALKSGVNWREKCEKSAKYLKSIHQHRTAQQYMPDSIIADDVDDKSIGAYLNEVTPTSTLTEEESDLLTSPITLHELQTQASRLSSQSSPGSDGLGYSYLALLFLLRNLVRWL